MTAVPLGADLGLSTRQIVMVGDTALDVAMARTAAARAVLVLTGPKSSGDSQHAKADAVIASIAQLFAWLE